MQKTYGDAVIEDLERLDGILRKFTKSDLIELQGELKKKIRKLEYTQKYERID